MCVLKSRAGVWLRMLSSVFSLRAYSENNENYVEVPLIFDPVRREDLHTDFRCAVRNTMSSQTLRTMVKEGMDFAGVGPQKGKTSVGCSVDVKQRS